jgi:hypothetical protein
MMTFVLRPDVHVAVVGDAMILLDLAGDDYLCLPDGACAIATGEGGAIQFTDAATAAALEAAGLLGVRPVPERTPLPLRPSATVIYQPPERRPTLLMWLQALEAALAVRRVEKGAGVAAYLALACGPGGDRTPARVAEAARVFWRMAPWLPIEGECLVRSALLMRFLKRRGLEADWVFGVRLWPFMAHCWVQLDDLCLNDDVERLAAYTPIYSR